MVVIGADRDDAIGKYAGSAYIYRIDGINWVEVTKLLASDGSNEDYFGSAVSISDSRALIGAPWSQNVNRLTGSAYIFIYDLCSSPDLTIEGNCPGMINFCISGLIPGDNCAILYSLNQGSVGPVPGCPNLYLNIKRPRVVDTGLADMDGNFCLLSYAPEIGCGRVLVQDNDIDTCQKTEVILIQ